MLWFRNNMLKMEMAIFILLSASVQVTESARILAWFPIPAISHQVVFRPLTQELAKRGHEVTVITTHPAFPKGETPTNLTEIHVREISYSSKNESKFSLDLFKQVKRFSEFEIKIFVLLLKNKDIKKIIEDNNKLDLLLFDGATCYPLALAHVLKIPAIRINSIGPHPGQLEAIGAPPHPFLYPTMIQRRIYDLTTLEKIHVIFTLWKGFRLMAKLNAVGEMMLKKHFGNDLPSLWKLEKNVDLHLLNQYPMWNNNQPVPSNVVFIGGIHKNPPKDLPQDLQTLLDSSQRGIIYMSLGSYINITLFSQGIMQCFIKVFSKLPYEVLWKEDEDDLPALTQNIRISKWFPQTDILRHPNVKLFITQGGFQSVNEAISAGVPLIGIPASFDQWFNVEHFVKYKVGLQLDIERIDENTLISAIETVIGDKSYRENVKKLNSLLRDQPMAPLDRAVWWTEHVIRHGGGHHLRTPAASMAWTDYYEINLVLVVLGVAVAVLLALIGLGWCLIRIILRKYKRVTDIKKKV